MKRITNILMIASAIACCLSVILFAVSFDLVLAGADAKSGELTARNSVALTSHCRCGVSGGGAWFFSHEYPYRGSLRFLSDDHGGVYYSGGHAREHTDWSWSAGDCGIGQLSYIGDRGQMVGRDTFCNLPGIYYRHFAGMNEPRPYWTLRVSLWYPMLLSAILPAWWMVRRVRAKLRVPLEERKLS